MCDQFGLSDKMSKKVLMKDEYALRVKNILKPYEAKIKISEDRLSKKKF